MNRHLADIPEINRIQKLAFKESHDKYHFCPAYETTDEQIMSYLEKTEIDIYKIITNNQIIGSAYVYIMGNNHYELDTITIDPIYQNTGIGTKVMELIGNNYTEALQWSLQTPETDSRNRHFYEKLGYTQVGSRYINQSLNLILYKKENK